MASLDSTSEELTSLIARRDEMQKFVSSRIQTLLTKPEAVEQLCRYIAEDVPKGLYQRVSCLIPDDYTFKLSAAVDGIERYMGPQLHEKKPKGPDGTIGVTPSNPIPGKLYFIYPTHRKFHLAWSWITNLPLELVELTKQRNSLKLLFGQPGRLSTFENLKYQIEGDHFTASVSLPMSTEMMGKEMVKFLAMVDIKHPTRRKGLILNDFRISIKSADQSYTKTIGMQGASQNIQFPRRLENPSRFEFELPNDQDYNIKFTISGKFDFKDVDVFDMDRVPRPIYSIYDILHREAYRYVDKEISLEQCLDNLFEGWEKLPAYESYMGI